MSLKTKIAATHERRDVAVQLKWFNAAKGFGFVVPDDEVVDAFIHITQLQKIGLNAIGDGARLVCHIEYTDKGAIVTEIVGVSDAGSLPDSACVPDPEMEGCFRMRGLVKNYTPERGFGFILPEDGMKDIFVHKSCLASSGIECLYAGQQVLVTFRTAQKGREAVKVVVEGNL